MSVGSSASTLAPGSRLGPYEIVAAIGAGGMGEVYRAHDPRIGRDVAVKVLPAAALAEPDRRERFEREARAAGRINHPNLLVLHDLGESDGVPYLVTELLDGQPLDERLDGLPLPWREAVRIAIEIAHGLAAAHAAGIVHRDLKPGNLFLTRDGRVKILDFGLAKLLPQARVGPPTADAETMSLHTEAGTVLGTVGYMAPEQATGNEADARTDLFSLGAVLFEMLAGRMAFGGSSALESLTAILRDEPRLPEDLANDLPETLRQIVARCLEKDPERRYQSAADFAFQLESVSQATVGSTDVAPRLVARRTPGVVTLIATALVASTLAFWLGRASGRARPAGGPAAAPPPALFPITSSGNDYSPSVSPDGKTVAFVSDRDGSTGSIWLMRRDTGEEVRLTEGSGAFPDIAPDGAEVLFVRDDSLYRISILGGQERKILDGAFAGVWSPDGQSIAFGRRVDEHTVEIVLAARDGGEQRSLMALTDAVMVDGSFSPDGRSIAFGTSGAAANIATPEIVVIDIASGVVRRYSVLLPGGVVFGLCWGATADTLVYSQSESRSPMGARYRLARLDLATGDSRVILRSEWQLGSLERLSDGRFVVEGRRVRGALLEATLDATEGSARLQLTGGASFDRQPVYSPDGNRIAFTSTRAANVDIWAVSKRDGSLRRLTDHPAVDWDPAFLPDGRLLFSSDRSGNFEIWIAEADGSRPRQLTRDGSDAENPSATADGWVVYNSSRPGGNGVWRIRPDGSAAERIVDALSGLPEASPQGDRLVYLMATDPTSASVRVEALPGHAAAPLTLEVRLPEGAPRSIVPGRSRWLPDGREIAFVGEGPERQMGIWRVTVEPGADRRLRPLVPGGLGGLAESFAISPDGRRAAFSRIDFEQTLLEVEGMEP